ncbi:unnamed protein product, partial [Candidula unifasciata]
INRQVAVVPTQQRTLEPDSRACVEMYLAKLEQEVAMKEQELFQERERLERKRREYADTEPDGRGCRHKQPTRTAGAGQVKASHSKSTDVQAETGMLPVGADPVPGNARDAGIRCQSPKVKDIVKKLDYSLNSDTESDASAEPEKRNTLSKRDTHSTQKKHSTPPASSTVSTVVPQVTNLPQRTDASTSVSFAHMSRIPTERPSTSLKCSTGTEMTPRRTTDYRAGSEPSPQILEDERPKMSKDRSDRTYTADHGFIVPEEETLSDVEIINLLSQQTLVAMSQRGQMSRSQSKVTDPHSVNLKTVTSTLSSQQPCVNFLQKSPTVIDKFHSTQALSPPMKSKPAYLEPETDAVLELFEVKRPLRDSSSRQQCLGDVLGREQVTQPGCKLGAAGRKLDVSEIVDDARSGDDDEHDMLDDEVSVEKVIQILNFSNREDVSPPQRSADVSGNVAAVGTQAVASGNSEIRDEAEDNILEVFFVRL